LHKCVGIINNVDSSDQKKMLLLHKARMGDTAVVHGRFVGRWAEVDWSEGRFSIPMLVLSQNAFMSGPHLLHLPPLLGSHWHCHTTVSITAMTTTTTATIRLVGTTYLHEIHCQIISIMSSTL
jgi:hypothetical protein